VDRKENRKLASSKKAHARGIGAWPTAMMMMAMLLTINQMSPPTLL
jgi:hypothetical protein